MTLSFGGGVRSEDLLSIPQNIRNMVDENYKKIAILDNINENFSFDREGKTIEKTINCDFEIKNAIIFLQGDYQPQMSGLYMKDFEEYYKDVNLGNYCNFTAKIFIKNKNTVVIDIPGSSSVKRFSLNRIMVFS